jgi:nicotinate-nucleotide--dimethylbenzimidazole phosphoribosyltransferase
LSYEQQLASVLTAVSRTDPADEDAAWARLDDLTKPPRSLGKLEALAARVARVQGSTRPNVDRKAIVLAAAPRVVAEGVPAYPQDVTWQMVANFGRWRGDQCDSAQRLGGAYRVTSVSHANSASSKAY